MLRGAVKEYERKQLLERVDRDGATVGVDVPERVDLDGDPFALREFVFETASRAHVPPAERERVEAVKRALRRERRRRLDRIETGEVSYEEGERIAAAVIGLDRALEALEGLDDDIAGDAARSEAADRKRWVSFLKRALGHDDGEQGERP